MKRFISKFGIVCALLLTMMTICVCSRQQTIQIQKGVVRTIQRPDKSSVYLSDVQISQRGVDTVVMSGEDGKFELVIGNPETDDAFYLTSVIKAGYELVDNNILGKARTCSPEVPTEIVMINIKEKDDDKERISKNAFRYAEETYNRLNVSLKRTLKQKSISEESYWDQKDDLYRWLKKYSSMVKDIAERYAMIDYAMIDSLNASINIAIENGEMERADSLIATAGSLTQLVKANREAESKAMKQTQMNKEIEGKASADIATIRRDINRLGDLLYSKHMVCFSKAESDSAVYYIKLRAELDSTNVEWQLDAGLFIGNYLGELEDEMSFFLGRLSNALQRKGEISDEAAAYYNIIGAVYDVQDEYTQALEYYNKALKIYMELYGEQHPSVATSYNNIGWIYEAQEDYIKALEYYNKALQMWKIAYGEQHPDVVMSYKNIGQIYNTLEDYPKAFECFNKVLEINIEIYGERHSSVASTYNDIAFICNSLKEYTKALEYFNKTLQIDIEIYGEEHPDVATVYSNMAYSYIGMKEHDKAMKNLRKSVSIYKALGMQEAANNIETIILVLDQGR